MYTHEIRQTRFQSYECLLPEVPDIISPRKTPKSCYGPFNAVIFTREETYEAWLPSR